MKARPYQEQSVQNVLDAYENGVRSGIVNIATGGGKTVIATEIAKRFRKKYGGKTLFLVNRIELAWQAQRSFIRADGNLRVGVEMGDSKVNPNSDIVIASVDTIGRKGSKRILKFNPDDFRLIVVDESHYSTSEIYDRVLTYFGVSRKNFQDNKLLVGLTATIQRSDGVSLGTVYDDIYAQYDIVYCMREGWLTDIEWVPVQTSTDISTLKTSNGEFIKKELVDSIDNPARNASIIKAYKELCDGETALIYAGSVEHAYKLAELFNAEGIRSECIEGSTDKKDRKEWLTSFRDNDIKVITNYMVLTTGYDNTELKNLFIVRPIKSTTTYIQILGRGLRPSETAFIDVWDTAEERLDAISVSDKPCVRVVDFCDVVGKHNVCTVPTLFGLNPKMRTKRERFYKDVVEVVEKAKREKNIRPEDIVDPDNIDLIYSREKITIKQYTPDEFISQASKLSWLPTGDGEYELMLHKDKRTIYTKQNAVGKFELYEYNMDNGYATLLQTFSSLAGAIKTGDEYCAEKGYDITFVKEADWKVTPPTEKQINMINRLGGKGSWLGKKFYDNGNPHVYYAGKLIETAGEASAILSDLFNRKRFKK